jgi:fused signal recognition particle receptor
MHIAILMFNFIKNKLNSFYAQFNKALNALLGRTSLDPATLKELEILLLSADTGVTTTQSIIKKLEAQASQKPLHEALAEILTQTLDIPKPSLAQKKVFLLVGINGSGKTTAIGKLAYRFKKEGKRVLVVAADTFRAAAPEQVATWATRMDVACVMGNPGQDSASVVYKGCEQFLKENYDILLIDTAGRLQTKTNLMNELAKIRRTIGKFIPDTQVMTLLTIDSMLGQNSLEQATLFKECATVDGIILTKLDGTGKGGIVFAIAHTTAIPIIFASYGESAEQFDLFDPKNFVHQLVYEKL